MAESNARQAAEKLGLAYLPYHVANRADVELAFVAMAKSQPDALVAGAGSGMLFGLRQLIVENTSRLRIALITTAASTVDLGALMSYGSPLEEGFRMAASYVDRMLQGGQAR